MVEIWNMANDQENKQKGKRDVKTAASQENQQRMKADLADGERKAKE